MWRWMLATVVATLLFATPAQAALIQDFSDFISGTNGIALGPDGNFWVAEEFEGNVVRMSPSGQVITRYPVGASPTSVATGPNGRVWVTVRGANKLVWFDATAPSPTSHDVSTATASNCGPVGLVAGAGRLFVSLPHAGACAVSRIASIADTGAGAFTTVNTVTAYDLAFASGKLFAPGEPDDVVVRLNPNPLGVESTVSTPPGSGPSGITVDPSGTVWATLMFTGAVARFPAVQQGGNASVISPSSGPLGQPFGIVSGPGGQIYVADKGSGNLVRINPANNALRFYSTGTGTWDIVNGPDGDLYFTDQDHARVRRFLSGPPRATTGGATNGTATATVDSRGNDTTVTFDYGPTTGYGQSVSTTIPAAAGPAPVAIVLPGLAGGTTYHVRVRATNEEGSAVGGDTTFLTAPADADHDGVSPPLDCNDSNAAIRPGAVDKPGDKIDQDCNGRDAAFPVLAASTTFGYGFIGSRTAITKLEIAKLAGGETVTITCKTKGKGCPFAKKTYRNVKKTSKRKLTSLFGTKHKLSTGAKVEVRITKSGNVGSSATLTVGKRKKQPKIVRKAINP